VDRRAARIGPNATLDDSLSSLGTGVPDEESCLLAVLLPAAVSSPTYPHPCSLHKRLDLISAFVAAAWCAQRLSSAPCTKPQARGASAVSRGRKGRGRSEISTRCQGSEVWPLRAKALAAQVLHQCKAGGDQSGGREERGCFYWDTVTRAYTASQPAAVTQDIEGPHSRLHASTHEPRTPRCEPKTVSTTACLSRGDTICLACRASRLACPQQAGATTARHLLSRAL
jgi:hypothetical protein